MRYQALQLYCYNYVTGYVNKIDNSIFIDKLMYCKSLVHKKPVVNMLKKVPKVGLKEFCFLLD